jgi:actin
MPDKSLITVPHSCRIKGPELLFDPSLDGRNEDGIHKLTVKSIQASDVDIRKDLAKNIILSGGTTMYEGLQDRLKAEVLNMLPANSEVRVIASADRKYAVWKGASTLASLSTFETSWIQKEEYEEHGAAIVHRKCS